MAQTEKQAYLLNSIFEEEFLHTFFYSPSTCDSSLKYGLAAAAAASVSVAAAGRFQILCLFFCAATGYGVQVLLGLCHKCVRLIQLRASLLKVL